MENHRWKENCILCGKDIFTEYVSNIHRMCAHFLTDMYAHFNAWSSNRFKQYIEMMLSFKDIPIRNYCKYQQLIKHCYTRNKISSVTEPRLWNNSGLIHRKYGYPNIV